MNWKEFVESHKESNYSIEVEKFEVNINYTNKDNVKLMLKKNGTISLLINSKEVIDDFFINRLKELLSIKDFAYILFYWSIKSTNDNRLKKNIIKKIKEVSIANSIARFYLEDNFLIQFEYKDGSTSYLVLDEKGNTILKKTTEFKSTIIFQMCSILFNFSTGEDNGWI